MTTPAPADDSQSSAVLIRTSVDAETVAGDLARRLVEDGLAACVQVNAVTSTYRWNGAVTTEAEWVLEIKTTREAGPAVVIWLLEHHPYEVPEILELAGTAHGPYAAWLGRLGV